MAEAGHSLKPRPLTRGFFVSSNQTDRAALWDWDARPFFGSVATDGLERSRSYFPLETSLAKAGLFLCGIRPRQSAESCLSRRQIEPREARPPRHRQSRLAVLLKLGRRGEWLIAKSG